MDIMEKRYNVVLTQKEWDFVCSALAKFPFEQVFGIINNIGKQVEGQKSKIIED